MNIIYLKEKPKGVIGVPTKYYEAELILYPQKNGLYGAVKNRFELKFDDITEEDIKKYKQQHKTKFKI